MKDACALLTLATVVAVAILCCGCATPFQDGLRERARFDLIAQGGEAVATQSVGTEVVELNGRHFTPESYARQSWPWRWFFAKAGDVTLNGAVYGGGLWLGNEIVESMEEEDQPAIRIDNNTGHVSIARDVTGSQSVSGHDQTDESNHESE